MLPNSKQWVINIELRQPFPREDTKTLEDSVAHDWADFLLPAGIISAAVPYSKLNATCTQGGRNKPVETVNTAEAGILQVWAWRRWVKLNPHSSLILAIQSFRIIEKKKCHFYTAEKDIRSKFCKSGIDLYLMCSSHEINRCVQIVLQEVAPRSQVFSIAAIFVVTVSCT